LPREPGPRSVLRLLGTARASAARVATYNQRSAKALDSVPTTELVREVLDETKELVRIETRLARQELVSDLEQLKYAAVFGGVAVGLALLTLVALLLAFVLAIGGSASAALLSAIVLLLAASLCAALAYQRLPKPPLARTRERLVSDVTQLKEHIQ
jgi:uncharacterized membrane protein YqjE